MMRSGWIHTVRSRGSSLLAVLILGAYIAVALHPFRWAPPQPISNGAVRTATIPVSFNSPGILLSKRPPEWLRKAIRRQYLMVRLRVQSFDCKQHGPARIFTISETIGLRNFTIGQSGHDLVVRLNTPETTVNGLPEHVVADVFHDPGWRSIQIVVRPSQLAVCVDGELVYERPISEQPFVTWNHRYLLALGNELTLDRPWTGRISRAIVEIGSEKWDCLSPERMYLPELYWLPEESMGRVGFKYQLWTADITDNLLNFICFVPLGYVLARAGRSRFQVVVAVVICAVVPLCVEVAQLFFAFRMPSLSDWVCNSLGGLVGAICATGPVRRALRPSVAGYLPARKAG